MTSEIDNSAEKRRILAVIARIAIPSWTQVLQIMTIALVSVAAACNSSPSTQGSGGNAGNGSGGSGASTGAGGGTAQTGGRTEGSTASGGNSGASGGGGVTAASGGTGAGGMPGSGGASGSSGTAGATAGAGGRTGGSTGAGGTPGRGGAPGTGGAPAAGGATGGTTPVGGASGSHYYASPSGSGTECSSAAPCSITQAQTVVRSAAGSMQSDIVVELADGVYPLTATLTLTAADSGTNGHTIMWQAATGAHPVLSGGKQITGWAVSDSGKSIWKATAPSSFATRQLYVDGKIATRARYQINHGDMSINTNGFTFSNSSLSLLNSLAHPERVDLHSICSFTDRYSPVKSIANGTVTMVQPRGSASWGR